MEYDIIATLGPATATPQHWEALLEAGATGFRLNTSHLDMAGVDKWASRLEAFQAVRAAFVPVVFDLQGSKWRIGAITTRILAAGEAVHLISGEENRLTADDIPVPHPDFFDAVEHSSGAISLNDAKIRLRVTRLEFGMVEAVVEQGGELSSHKGITLPQSTYRRETLSRKDENILDRTGGNVWARFAISYVRDGTEMERYRSLAGCTAHLIAKIERRTALYDVMRIAGICDSVWLCRGDLGAELGLAEMARAAARISLQASMLPKPLYLAGQVLEHMAAHPTPTRAEVCNLYDALAAGYAGVVLSDETAIGQYPVEAVRAAAMFHE